MIEKNNLIYVNFKSIIYLFTNIIFIIFSQFNKIDKT